MSEKNFHFWTALWKHLAQPLFALYCALDELRLERDLLRYYKRLEHLPKKRQRLMQTIRQLQDQAIDPNISLDVFGCVIIESLLQGCEEAKRIYEEER